MKQLKELINSNYYESDEEIIIDWFKNNNSPYLIKLLFDIEETKIRNLKENLLFSQMVAQYSSATWKDTIKEKVFKEYKETNSIKESYPMLINYIRLTKESNLDLDKDLLNIIYKFKNNFHEDVLDYLEIQKNKINLNQN